jgi:hypothetical protein
MKSETDKIPISRQLVLLSSTLGAVTLQLRKIARELTTQEAKPEAKNRKNRHRGS